MPRDEERVQQGQKYVHVPNGTAGHRQFSAALSKLLHHTHKWLQTAVLRRAVQRGPFDRQAPAAPPSQTDEEQNESAA